MSESHITAGLILLGSCIVSAFVGAYFAIRGFQKTLIGTIEENANMSNDDTVDEEK